MTDELKALAKVVRESTMQGGWGERVIALCDAVDGHECWKPLVPLAGYRELGAKCAQFENERDAAFAEVDRVTVAAETAYERLEVERDDAEAERDKLAAENAALVAKVTKLREAIEKIMREEDAANLSKYDCPSSQLRWAIEEAEELLKEAEGAP